MHKCSIRIVAPNQRDPLPSPEQEKLKHVNTSAPAGNIQTWRGRGETVLKWELFGGGDVFSLHLKEIKKL